MKVGPLLAVIFGFFLIMIYPYYADDEPPVPIFSDDDGDRVPNNKDKCPEEDASGKDIDEDGCIDEITKEEIDYIERISKFNLGQYILFAALSLLGTAIYWEREKLKAALYEKDDLDLSKFKSEENIKDLEDDVDYDKLGETKEYNVQTESNFSKLGFTFKKLNEEADRGTQIICVLCIIGLLVTLGFIGESPWFIVEGTKEHSEYSETFEVQHYSEHLEYSTTQTSGNNSGTSQSWNIGYESSRCTDNLDLSYNCDYRLSLFGTINTLLSISLFFCFFALLLAFRAEKYRSFVAAVFSIALVASMASLLIFTALVDNALTTDEHTLDMNQEIAGGCWMSEPVIWGESNCIELQGNGIYVTESNISYSPSINFFVVLVCTSILFVGLFTHISPMITMEKISWTEAIQRNWQIFAIIFGIIFLWRINILLNNL